MVSTEIFRYKNITSFIFSQDLVPADQPISQGPARVMSETASPAPGQPRIVLSPVQSRPGEVIRVPDEERVEKVLKKLEDEYGIVTYLVRFGDGGEYPVSARSSE